MPLAMRQAKKDLLDKPSKLNDNLNKKLTFLHSAWAKKNQPQAKTLAANDAKRAPTRKRASGSIIQKDKGKSEYLSHKRISDDSYQ